MYIDSSSDDGTKKKLNSVKKSRKEKTILGLKIYENGKLK